MKQDWETKRYSLDDIEGNDAEFNGNSHNINWIEFLLSKCNWETLETLNGKEGQNLLTKLQILDIQGKIESKQPSDVNIAFDAGII